MLVFVDIELLFLLGVFEKIVGLIKVFFLSSFIIVLSVDLVGEKVVGFIRFFLMFTVLFNEKIGFDGFEWNLVFWFLIFFVEILVEWELVGIFYFRLCKGNGDDDYVWLFGLWMWVLVDEVNFGLEFFVVILGFVWGFFVFK